MQRSIINKTIISWSHSTPRMLGSVAPALRDAPSARWARLLAWPQLSPPGTQTSRSSFLVASVGPLVRP